MRKAIDEIIKSIHLELKSQSTDSISLFSGRAGYSLFDILYSRQFNNDKISKILQNDLQEIAENSFGYPNATIANGQSGINWFFTYLYNQGYLEYEVKEIINSNNDFILLKAEEYMNVGLYDFLHGVLGISYYLLYNSSFNDESFFDKIFLCLNELKRKHGEAIPNWDSENNKFEYNSANLGLAHGLPSVLKFCIQCYKQNICAEQAQELAESIVYFLSKVKNPDTSISYYPGIYRKEGYYPFSRLAWCYGDLSLAFILHQYGVCFKDEKTKNFALEILRETTYRKSQVKTQVNDIGICHGSAGIAHIYNKLWHCTKEKVFKEACDFWIKNIIDLWKKDDNAIYQKYNPSIKCYENCSSLIEGSVGVGLVLLSYLSKDFSWDYCLMLND